METYSLARSSMMSKVFFGLFLSLIAALAGFYAGQYVPIAMQRILMFVELGMIFFAMFMQRRRAVTMSFVLIFTFISGITLYLPILAYISILGMVTVAKAVAVSAVTFAVAALVAARTSVDFSFFAGFLFVGLIALLIMGLVSMFTGFSTVTEFIYSLLGIAVFVGYVLFDVNRIAHRGVTEAQIPWVVLSLYLDFINLLLFVLRFLGVLQSSRR